MHDVRPVYNPASIERFIGLRSFGSIALSPGVAGREIRGELAVEKPDLKLLQLLEQRLSDLFGRVLLRVLFDKRLKDAG